VASPRSIAWSKPALADARATYEYFLERSPQYADAFLSRIESAADSLTELSERGRRVPELKLPNVRELVVEKHRLVYQLESGRVTILRLIHGRRDFKSSWKSTP
jgi:plasmid stabilization system protein ParE